MALKDHKLASGGLPPDLPVFPLAGVVLLPSATLPLTIFEPRYLAMIEDALGAGRLLAMAQPIDPDEDPSDLYGVGCLGRIVSFAEVAPERFEVSLLGVCRVKFGDEVPAASGYRRFKASADGFESDAAPSPRTLFDDPEAFFDTLTTYAQMQGFGFDWDMLRGVPHGNLVNALSMACPFDAREKQALLEAKTPQERADLLHNLLQISLASPLSSGSTQ